MSKKTLAVTLSKIKVFHNPKQSLEQYPTDSEVGATALWSALMNGWIKDMTIADFGAGTGLLGIGCLLLGAKKVYFVEKDKDAAKILRENLKDLYNEYELGSYEILEGDISMFKKKVDLVVMNPPFGTVEKGSDLEFLDKATDVSSKIITFHKTETIQFIENKIKDKKYDILGRSDVSFPLKKTLEHHRKAIQRVNVSYWLIEKTN